MKESQVYLVLLMVLSGYSNSLFLVGLFAKTLRSVLWPFRFPHGNMSKKRRNGLWCELGSSAGSKGVPLSTLAEDGLLELVGTGLYSSVPFEEELVGLAFLAPLALPCPLIFLRFSVSINYRTTFRDTFSQTQILFTVLILYYSSPLKK
jgi:hypothetical protein